MSIRWEVNLKFGRLKARTDASADKAVLTGMEALRAIVTPLVPIDTGRLVGSADVGLGGVGVDETLPHTAHLYFPGPYALYQHEGVYFRRPAYYGAPLHHNHGQSFFLIQPAVTHAQEIIDIVGHEVKKSI